MHDTIELLYFRGIRASPQRTSGFQCGESGSPKDNSSDPLRPKKVGGCNDLAQIAALAPQFPDAATDIAGKCLECAAILSDWLINDMVAAAAYI